MDQPRTNLQRSNPYSLIVPLAVALVAALGYAAFRYDRGAAPVPDSSPKAVAPESVPDSAISSTAPASATDPASLLGRVTGNSLFRRWLANGDLVHRWALVTANLAQGESLRVPLEFLAPPAHFAVVPVGVRLFISPDSYARYDAIAEVIHSVDAHALATAYRTLHPALEAAYRALGYPRGSLERATTRGLRRIENAPIPRQEPAVEAKDGVFVFTDRRLEELGYVEKQLLRMGPRNERLIQAKAREVLDALELRAAASER